MPNSKDNSMVKVTVKRGNARQLGKTPGTTISSKRYIASTGSYVSGSSSRVKITVRRSARGS